MKKSSYLSLLFITLLIAGCKPQADKVELHIFHTSDTHSCIEPLTDNNTAGYVRRATYIKSLRDTLDKNLLLLDCGDFSQGSLYYEEYKGETEIKLMNEMGYDAATIGNHEFDFGLENMARLFKMARFPIVCANYNFTGTPVEGLVKPYTVLERKGIRIGVFGLSPQPENLVAKDNYKGMTYADPVAKANETAALLRDKEHCDVVVCLSHLGVGSKFLPNDTTLIDQTRGIDVVLGGHSHTYFEQPKYYPNLDGKQVILQHMGKNGRYVGEVTVTLEAKKEK